ncbi:hypothetical protein ACOJUR_08695 [Alicyclobacillus tolerans]|uniref:hypothetical protein n=1 Tax=Alicyclobacillus tolerans TaxID=90970 RepID=UPI003B7CB461
MLNQEQQQRRVALERTYTEFFAPGIQWHVGQAVRVPGLASKKRPDGYRYGTIEAVFPRFVVVKFDDYRETFSPSELYVLTNQSGLEAAGH